MEDEMDTLVTLNFIGYAAVLAGGLVLGTLFGRSMVSDFSALVHQLEARVIALETMLHFGKAAVAAASDPAAATAAIKSHAEATEKLASAIATHAAAKAAGN
jgi:hypothetical protein